VDNSLKLPGRSYGLKLFVVCALVLLMGIPALMISAISFERSDRATQVTNEVSQRYGGHQYVTGPILSVPYYLTQKDELIEKGDYIIFPEDGMMDLSSVDVEIKKRSLFNVPVYRAKGKLTAQFDELGDQSQVNDRMLDWEKARTPRPHG